MSVRVGLGTGFAKFSSPQDMWSWLSLCEHSGLDSVWHSDQLLAPTMEPIVSLAAAIGATKRLRFGASAVVLPLREPILLAKQIATLDFLSMGRVFPVFGIGQASDPVWQATGWPVHERGKRADEALRLIRRLLSPEPVIFRGDFFTYEGPPLGLSSARDIPIWIAGNSAAAMERTAQFGDGWLGTATSPEDARRNVGQIKYLLDKYRRNIDPDHYGLALPLALRTSREQGDAALHPKIAIDKNLIFSGTLAELRNLLMDYIAAGISKFVLLPVAQNIDEFMFQTELIIREIVPAVEAVPFEAGPG